MLFPAPCGKQRFSEKKMMNRIKLPVILDGDPGHDDAIAWVLARSSDLLDILAVTSVCGNQTIEKTTYNTLRIMTLIGLDAPMAMGRTKPLIGEPIIVPTVHGKSGLDGPVLPEPAFQPVEKDASELMAELIGKSPDPVMLIPTGPLTNVAALLLASKEDPDPRPKRRPLFQQLLHRPDRSRKT